jgi:hypothetical protein
MLCYSILELINGNDQPIVLEIALLIKAKKCLRKHLRDQ